MPVAGEAATPVTVGPALEDAGQVGISAAGEADIDLAVIRLAAGYGCDLVELAVRVGPDIGPRLRGVVGRLPDAIDVVDISNNVDGRIALPGSRRAEPEGEDVEDVVGSSSTSRRRWSNGKKVQRRAVELIVPCGPPV